MFFSNTEKVLLWSFPGEKVRATCHHCCGPRNHPIDLVSLRRPALVICLSIVTKQPAPSAAEAAPATAKANESKTLSVTSAIFAIVTKMAAKDVAPTPRAAAVERLHCAPLFFVRKHVFCHHWTLWYAIGAICAQKIFFEKFLMGHQDFSRFLEICAHSDKSFERRAVCCAGAAHNDYTHTAHAVSAGIRAQLVVFSVAELILRGQRISKR
jgi:hypothetical protein